MTLDLTLSRLAGDESRPRLLVVGPSLGTAVATLWGTAAGLVPDDWEVVGWDLPGHGDGAPSSEPFSVADLAAAVRRRADELASGRPAAYAGVSVGGATGLHLALDPGPFERVAVLAGAAKIGEPEGWRDRAAQVRRSGTAAMVAGSSERWFAPGFLERDPATGNALLVGLTEVDDEGYALTCEALAGHDVRDRLGEIALPVLVLGGREDPVVDPDLATATATAIPDGRLRILDDVAHQPPAEAPHRTVAELVEFLTPPEETP